LGAVFDEVAFWRSEESANPDAEIETASGRSGRRSRPRVVAEFAAVLKT
jgi:hypothetical protein